MNTDLKIVLQAAMLLADLKGRSEKEMAAIILEHLSDTRDWLLETAAVAARAGVVPDEVSTGRDLRIFKAGKTSAAAAIKCPETVLSGLISAEAVAALATEFGRRDDGAHTAGAVRDRLVNAGSRSGH
jgi:hypothetical protein